MCTGISPRGPWHFFPKWFTDWLTDWLNGWLAFAEHLNWRLSGKNRPKVLLPCGCLPCGNMESALPENSNKTIVCFKHIKVAGETPESKPILPHRHIKAGRKTLFDIRQKPVVIPPFYSYPRMKLPFSCSTALKFLDKWRNKVSMSSQIERNF